MANTDVLVKVTLLTRSGPVKTESEIREVNLIKMENSESILRQVEALRDRGGTPTAVYVHSAYIDWVIPRIVGIAVYPSLTIMENEIRIV